MDKVYDKCCGIDVHKKLIVACFRKGSKQELRNFGATTRELLELANWLQNGGCEMVAMESTASYWKPLYNILESSELKAMVVNASHMKAVPGRKTDTKDAEWIADRYISESGHSKTEQRPLSTVNCTSRIWERITIISSIRNARSMHISKS